jgi:hypothetical protein
LRGKGMIESHNLGTCRNHLDHILYVNRQLTFTRSKLLLHGVWKIYSEI